MPSTSKPEKLNVTSSIGVDLGGTKISAGLGKNGLIKQKRTRLLTDKESLDCTLSQVIKLIKPLVKNSVKGIGIGVPSVVDLKEGIVYNVTNIPSWKQVPIKKILQDEFDLPVFVNNDVNCFVMGEFQFGLARGFQNVVGLTIGTGLGAGIILDGKPYYGQNCGAGEVGLFPYLDHTIEYYASGNFFNVFHQVSALEAFNLATENEPKALKAWQEFGQHLGNALKMVIYAYDPQIVVMGGSLTKAFPYFQASMLDALNGFEFPETIRKVKIFASQNENISLLGAVAMVQ